MYKNLLFLVYDCEHLHDNGMMNTEELKISPGRTESRQSQLPEFLKPGIFVYVCLTPGWGDFTKERPVCDPEVSCTVWDIPQPDSNMGISHRQF